MLPIFWYTHLPPTNYLPNYFKVENCSPRRLISHFLHIPTPYLNNISPPSLWTIHSLSHYKQPRYYTYLFSYNPSKFYWRRYDLITNTSYTSSETTITQRCSIVNLQNTFNGCISTLSPINICLYWPVRLIVNQMIGAGIRLSMVLPFTPYLPINLLYICLGSLMELT